jgi:hypothetical protein
MAIKLIESLSVAPLSDRGEGVLIANQNLDPEAIGMYDASSTSVEAMKYAYHRNVVALDKAIQALEKLRDFCAYRSKGFQARARGDIQQALEWEHKAELEYNQLPKELKW